MLEITKDELHDEAVCVVQEAGRAGLLLLQRKLNIGYARANSLLQALERDGIWTGASRLP